MSSVGANILSGLLFVLIPGLISTVYGVSRSQWKKRQENVVFTIGMLSYAVWWLGNFVLFTWTLGGSFELSRLFLVVAPALVLVTGFIGVAAGRMAFKLRMRRQGLSHLLKMI